MSKLFTLGKRGSMKTCGWFSAAFRQVRGRGGEFFLSPKRSKNHQNSPKSTTYVFEMRRVVVGRLFRFHRHPFGLFLSFGFLQPI